MLERDVSEVTGFPAGVAVTPDGRWLISLGFTLRTVTVYDATTLEPVAGPLEGIDSIHLAMPHAVVVSPDGSMAVLTNRTGVIGVCLPSLELLFHLSLLSPRHVVRDRAGENYYVSGERNGIARLTPSGQLGALFENQENLIAGIALTRDERELLVLTENGNHLIVLTTPDLSQQFSVDLPLKGEAVVPLRDGRAIVVGGRARSGGITAVGLPLMAAHVDLATGAVDSLQVLFEGSGGRVLLGDGNEWVDVGESTAIVPTQVGTVTIDTNLGTVVFHPAAELGRDLPPCCDIGRYPDGNRVVFSALALGAASRGGSLILYDVDETVDTTPP